MPKLIPADLKRCQVMKPNGNTFMTLGGRPGLERCTNKPNVVAKENRPGKDGKRGSMSLCIDCLGVFVRQKGAGFATITQINKIKGKQR